MWRNTRAIRGLLVLSICLSYSSLTKAGVVEDFGADPFGAWSIAAGPGAGFSPVADPFTYDGVTDTLVVHYDSSHTTARLQHPLGDMWTQADQFLFGATLTFDSIDAPYNDFMQISFALTNSETTGSVRAGAALEDANTFDNIELGYFPNDSDFGGFYVTGTVQGDADGATHAFEHFSSDAVSMALPIGETLTFLGAYDPKSSTLLFRVVGETVDLEIEVDTLGDTFGQPAGAFLVDTLAITSYFDGADFTPESTSLIADVTYDDILATRFSDGDGDGDVDLLDFAGFQLCYSGADAPATPMLTCAPYDVDHDRDVDLADFGVFQLEYTGSL